MGGPRVTGIVTVPRPSRLPDAVTGIQFTGNSLRFYKRDVAVVFSESQTAKPVQRGVGEFAAFGPSAPSP